MTIGSTDQFQESPRQIRSAPTNQADCHNRQEPAQSVPRLAGATVGSLVTLSPAREEVIGSRVVDYTASKHGLLALRQTDGTIITARTR